MAAIKRYSSTEGCRYTKGEYQQDDRMHLDHGRLLIDERTQPQILIPLLSRQPDCTATAEFPVPPLISCRPLLKVRCQITVSDSLHLIVHIVVKDRELIE